ncbi:MAG TPA: protein-glutamate O-methyltransferase CheR [Terriglobales bacterium]|nr:protein-glutamate O-methyltransferase CheR [Terriglobales bacterium]
MSASPVRLNESEEKLLQALVYRECGMVFDERRSHFLRDRLQRRLRACALDSFYSYYRLLTSDAGKQELAILLENLTVNETSFFRNKPQLDLFQKVALEQALERKCKRQDWSLRVWSAGCSTGQEPYTLAMLICETLGFFNVRHSLPVAAAAAPLEPRPLAPPPWRVEILASDISYSVLRAAAEGLYTQSQMEAVDYSYRLRFFDRVGEKSAVKDALKKIVHFDFHNLKAGFLPQRHDFIFCRNVMIYFDAAEQKRLTEKFHRCLAPGGYLFIGHAETLLPLTEKFRIVHQCGGTAYQRMEPPE